MWHGTRGAIWTTLFALVGASMAALAMLGGPVTGEDGYLITWGAGVRFEVSPLRWCLSLGALVAAFTSILLAAIWHTAFLSHERSRGNCACCDVCRRRQRIAGAVFIVGFLIALASVFLSPALHDKFYPRANPSATKQG